jgi:hypothetical protein
MWKSPEEIDMDEGNAYSILMIPGSLAKKEER